jgi:hypothetical protein
MNFLDDALFPKIGESYSGAEEKLAKLGYAPNRKNGVRGVPLRAA